MSKPVLSLILIAASIGAAGRAQAQDAVTIADIRCVVVGMQIYDSVDSARQATGIWLSLYYIGQLRGRAPQLDIESLLVEEARKMTASESASEAKRCAAGLSAISELISRMSNDLLQGQGKHPTNSNTPSN